jgi:hypothetical protein
MRPDLAAEVVSPSNLKDARELQRFRVGLRELFG